MSGHRAALQASLPWGPRYAVYRPRRLSSEPIKRTYELHEHERWVVLVGWSSKVVCCVASPQTTLSAAQNLFPTDPDEYTDTVKGTPKLKATGAAQPGVVCVHGAGSSAGAAAGRALEVDHGVARGDHRAH